MSLHLPKCLVVFFFNRCEAPVLVKSNSKILMEHCLNCYFTAYLDYNCLYCETIKKIVKKEGGVPLSTDSV